jgi:hypothetical protein
MHTFKTRKGRRRDMIGKWNVDVETRRYDINSLLLHSKIIG